MPNETVIAEGAPAPSGPYSPAILATGTRVLTISGQIADGADGVVGGDDAGEQARECLRKLDALLQAAGASKADVVKVTIFLTDMAGPGRGRAGTRRVLRRAQARGDAGRDQRARRPGAEGGDRGDRDLL